MDGCFDPQAVSIEKQMLKKGLEDEINDKRIYCLHQANREFFGDSPAGVRQEGYLEEVDGLTPAMLTAAYQQMLRTANIELLVLGCNAAQTAAIRDALLAELSCIDRAPLPLVENMAMPTIAPVHKTENYDMVQAKLCMLFTLGQPMQPQQLAAVRLAMALYGGSVTSRLFLNVRERDHLCYYCSSSFQSFTGSMAVNSGVEHADAARAEQAILKELADLCTGPITDEEFEDCRRGLLSGMNGVEDSLGGIETWYYMEVLRGSGLQTPDEARAALRAVLGSDVSALSKALASPVGVERIAVFPVENFGSAMAPLYTTLALFIGSLLILVVFKPKADLRIQKEAGLVNPKPRQLFFGRFAVMAVVSLAQSTVMALGNLFFLDVQVTSPWLFMVCFWGAGLVFTFIIYALVVSFANLGKAIAVLLLIVQVTGCGGSFPLQIMPDFVQALSPWLPATHVVNAMRSAMMGTYGGDFWAQMGALALFLIPAALLGLVLRKPLEKFMEWYVEKVESSKLIS